MEFIAFIPFFIIYRRRALPYFVSLISHPLIGDFIVGGNLQLFWPITKSYYGLSIAITSPTNVALEFTLFIIAIIILVTTKDLMKLLKPHLSNLILLIPTLTVLLPAIVGFPLQVPTLLLIPHIIYILLFLASIASTFRSRQPNKSDG